MGYCFEFGIDMKCYIFVFGVFVYKMVSYVNFKFLRIEELVK